jgi:hypothetical protein
MRCSWNSRVAKELLDLGKREMNLDGMEFERALSYSKFEISSRFVNELSTHRFYY